ncbi:zinc knuckle [Colletotrichum abscissum]|uniref:Zinc knuckle n=1 Tax=Colletotrichum abscissum TaxID=1671311 RepID=A0A9P9WZI7_9PEZI|nr:zinc knuckle [Colletotrichum abscissum]
MAQADKESGNYRSKVFIHTDNQAAIRSSAKPKGKIRRVPSQGHRRKDTSPPRTGTRSRAPMGTCPHRYPGQRSSRHRRQGGDGMEARRTDRSQGRQAESLIQTQVNSQDMVA